MPFGAGSVVVRAKVSTPRIENTNGAAVRAGAMPAEIAGLILQGSTDGLRLAAGGGIGTVRIHNVDLRANGGTGLRVTGGGSGPLDTGVNVAGTTIAAQGGPAVDIEGAAIDIQLPQLQSLGSASTGINLVEAFGPFSAGAGSRIEGSAGDAVHLEGGNGELSFGGAIASRPTGHSVLVAGRAGGKVSFSGPITDSGLGISLSDAGTASFSGGLTLRPAAGSSGFVAAGGGTVSVTGAANTVVASGGGRALSIQGTAIAASGLTFQSLAVTGTGGSGEIGVRLENTGTAGGLTVTGTGTAGSGGTIQGLGGSGIALAGTSGVSLSFLNIQSNGDDGIQGANVTGLRLAGCRILGNGNAESDQGLDFDNLFGAVAIADTEVSGSGHHDVRIANTAGTLSSLAITGSRFVEPHGGYGLDLEAGGTAAINGVSITGSTLAGNPSGLKMASTGGGKISGFTTAASTFTGGAAMEFSESQMATLTCRP
jgi:hypothetical protein